MRFVVMGAAECCRICAASPSYSAMIWSVLKRRKSSPDRPCNRTPPTACPAARFRPSHSTYAPRSWCSMRGSVPPASHSAAAASAGMPPDNDRSSSIRRIHWKCARPRGSSSFRIAPRAFPPDETHTSGTPRSWGRYSAVPRICAAFPTHPSDSSPDNACSSRQAAPPSMSRESPSCRLLPPDP